MKKEEVKQILLGLGTITCAFFLSFNSASAQNFQSLQLQSPTTAIINQDLRVQVVTVPAVANATLQFIPQDPNISYSPFVTNSCVTGSNGSCGVTFRSSQAGIFKARVWGTPLVAGRFPNPATDPRLDFDINVTSSPQLTATYNQTALTNQDVQITAKTTGGSTSGVVVSFSATPSGPTFYPGTTCTTKPGTAYYGSCSVTFKSATAGIFGIAIKAAGYTSPSFASIVVTAPTSVTTTPTSSTNPKDMSKYIPLIPLPNPDGKPGEPLNVVDVGGPDGLSTYLNYFIKLIIGLAAVLAVVMIVWGGIEYMMTELIGEKAAAKKRIYEAVLGLILALGSWLILNEINTDLLKTGVNIGQTTIRGYDDETETPPDATLFSVSPPSGTVNLCTTGISTVNTSAGGFVVCNSISSNVQNMINTARSKGIMISGWGWRSANQQIQLRTAHCGSTKYDIYDKPSSQCTPPTARPGASRHESGVAVDFTCTENGKTATIQTTDNTCFRWLQQNAGNYGFKNLPSEPWHWSTDGR